MRRAWFKDWLAFLATPCPLCGLSSRRGDLCAGCDQDVYATRHSRLLCVGCANDLSVHKTPLPTWNSAHQSDQNAAAIHSTGNSNPSVNTQHMSQGLCRLCQRIPRPFDAMFCAVDDCFPAALMINRFSRCATDLTLSPVLAALMWRSCQSWLQQHPIYQPDFWVPVPASNAQLARCHCNPSQELARSLSRLTGIARLPSALRRIEDAGIEDHVTAQRFEHRRIGLVLDSDRELTVIQQAAQVCRAMGASHVIVLCAAKQID